MDVIGHPPQSSPSRPTPPRRTHVRMTAPGQKDKRSFPTVCLLDMALVLELRARIQIWSKAEGSFLLTTDSVDTTLARALDQSRPERTGGWTVLTLEILV